MKSVPWIRSAAIEAVRDRIWKYLSQSSVSEKFLEASALLQMDEADLMALGRIHFVLSDEVGRLLEDLPYLIRRLPTVSIAEEERSYNGFEVPSSGPRRLLRGPLANLRIFL